MPFLNVCTTTALSASLLQASVPVSLSLSFGPCRMLSLDALIRSKETLGRDQDMAALRQLRAIRERIRPADH
jgi:hypothetical protein